MISAEAVRGEKIDENNANNVENSNRLLYCEYMSDATANMICTECKTACRRFGKHRNGLQRFRCADCGKTYTESHEKPLGSMTIPQDKAVLALQLLLEGTSVRSTERITGLHRDTILKLLVLAGEKCEKIMGAHVRNVAVRDVEVDELWSFIGKKEKRVRPEDDQNMGDAYVFVAIERNSKLVLNIAMGKRDNLHRRAP